MSTIVPLGQLFGGKSIRLTPPMGPTNEQCLSVRDVIMVVGGQESKRANEVWQRLSPEVKDELAAFCGHFKFSGRGQSDQPVISFTGALKLVMMLPGETAKKTRGQFVQILTRFYAGDSSLHGEIQANGASSAPINRLAQEAASGTGLTNSQDVVGMKRYRDLCEETARFQQVIISRQNVMVDLFMREMTLVTAKKDLADVEASKEKLELMKWDKISQIEKERDERAIMRNERLSQIEKDKQEYLANVKVNLATKLATIPSSGPAQLPIWTPSVSAHPPVNPKTILELARVMPEWGQLSDDDKSRLVNKCGRDVIGAPYNIPFMSEKVKETSPTGSEFHVNQFEQPYHFQVTQALQALVMKMRRDASSINLNSQRTIMSCWNNN